MTSTSHENLQLSVLRANVKDVIRNPDDHFLLRWLKARDFDVEKAEEMLRNCLEWRKNNVEFKLMQNWTPHISISENIQFKFIGFDCSGRPVLWVPFGRWEVRKLLESEYKDECYRLQYKILEQVMEKVENQRIKCGADQFIVIGDSAELSFRKVAHYETIQSILRFFKEFELYYPELLYSAYVINTPMVFSYIFNLVKPFITARTLSKVKMYDFDETKWKPVLLKELPINVIPIEYGGNGEKVFPSSY